MKVSVIVPIFNTEQYLDRCLQSIVNQTENEIEIILIDDGSTDSSGSVCDSWAKKDQRIHVIHKKNEGVTIARKTGVEHSTSDWICFVDSDDELPETSIHTLYKHILDSIDLIIGYVDFIRPKEMPFKWNKYNYEKKDTLQYMKSLLNFKIHSGPYAKLIRKTLFDSFTFDIPQNITMGEDFVMNLRLGQKARQIILLPDTVYNYFYRINSATNNKQNMTYVISLGHQIKLSIEPKYRKSLKIAVTCCVFRRQWRCLKLSIKEFLHKKVLK